MTALAERGSSGVRSGCWSYGPSGLTPGVEYGERLGSPLWLSIRVPTNAGLFSNKSPGESDKERITAHPLQLVLAMDPQGVSRSQLDCLMQVKGNAAAAEIAPFPDANAKMMQAMNGRVRGRIVEDR